MKLAVILTGHARNYQPTYQAVNTNINNDSAMNRLINLYPANSSNQMGGYVNNLSTSSMIQQHNIKASASIWNIDSMMEIEDTLPFIQNHINSLAVKTPYTLVECMI